MGADDEKKPFNQAFAGLTGLRDKLPAGEPAKSPASAQAKPAPPRAVVRMERKGRGGKEVTAVEQLELSPAEREDWLKALKQSLGCGGAMEGESLVLQGDHRDRVKAWLQQRGVKKISVG